MTFRRINDTTINCIISPEDLRSRGIKIDDLLERKEEAMNYLRETIVEAARREHFNLESQYSSMRISILPDHSISLTLTEGGKPVEKAAKKEHIPYDQPYTPAASEQSKKQEPQKKEFCFALHSMEEAILCSRGMTAESANEFASSLYYEEETEEYDFIVETKDESGAQFRRIVLSLNEFGTLAQNSEGRIAYIKEHGKCILKEKAAQQLAELSV